MWYAPASAYHQSPQRKTRGRPFSSSPSLLRLYLPFCNLGKLRRGNAGSRAGLFFIGKLRASEREREGGGSVTRSAETTGGTYLRRPQTEQVKGATCPLVWAGQRRPEL